MFKEGCERFSGFGDLFIGKRAGIERQFASPPQYLDREILLFAGGQRFECFQELDSPLTHTFRLPPTTHNPPPATL